MDDPIFHQGRTRVVPATSGHWPAHIYMEFAPADRLQALLNDVVKMAQKHLNCHTLLTSEYGLNKSLHISLSPPVYLKECDIPGFRALIKNHTAKFIDLRFSKVICMANETSSRYFLAVDFDAATNSALAEILDQINHCLRSFRLDSFEVRWHAA